MSYINDLLAKLFWDKKSNFSHKENFALSEEDEEKIRQWRSSAEGKMAIALIKKNYSLTKAGIKEKPEVHVLSSPYANGFAVTFENPMTEKTFSNLFFAFGQRMLDLGYYRVSMDRKLQDSADIVKTTEKQYFKPIFDTSAAQKMDQIFGNVSIEKVLINNKPSFLKVLVTVYSDQHYHDAQPFDQYIEKLFDY